MAQNEPDQEPAAAGAQAEAVWSGLGDLARLAAEFGVATSYDGQDGAPVTVAPSAVQAVLNLLGVDTSDPARALDDAHAARWRRPLPPVAVARSSAPKPVAVHLPAGPQTTGTVAGTPSPSPTPVPAATAFVALADGGEVAAAVRLTDGTREVGGYRAQAGLVDLPAGLPLGDHQLVLRLGADTAQCPLIVVPDRVPDVLGDADGLPAVGGPGGNAPGGSAPDGGAPDGGASGRAWGWMIQLYALASAGSWAMGDFADLATIAAWSGHNGADVLLVNPLHAAAPTFPVEPSPYSPSSRRFVSPLYLRPEITPEYLRADGAVRAEVDRLAGQARADGIQAGLIDRDVVWRAKLAALELLFASQSPASPGAQAAPASPGAQSAPGVETPNGTAGGGHASGAPGGERGALADFALWSALAERHGRDWRVWPEDLRDPAAPAVATARAELAHRVAFHTWLQRRCDEQLAAAQEAARAAGMRVGIVHDLAVGVDPGGADAWAMRAVLAAGASVGAPPDGFNQQGQDWGLPPWRPAALAEAGYAPFRAMVRAVLARGGGIRVDHILGLFRLWWVPVGAGAAGGTFVRYDASALLGLLALEAARAGSLVVGEDLGTVEPSVATALDEAGIFGSSVLWFERAADGSPRRPDEYRVRSMASVTTHDLPTAAGFLDGEHVRVRERLGVLARSGDAERAAWLAERADLLRLLAAENLLPDEGLAEKGPADEEVVLGMHAVLGRSRARVVLIAPGDAFGDLRQPNLPGTVDSYPNWRLPVLDGDATPVTVERLLTDPRPRRLAESLGARPADGARPAGRRTPG
ncbi:4-alpha-glucanotransferase [Parafrankia irregularis]|uniref:4-alpha-glucanotransferase n=1 Tax=Parafrankia irregularis TaxID=795642 RepID=UPI001F61C53F|nr:4-alpha-glucanotransferase [Parafrankia irregularis]